MGTDAPGRLRVGGYVLAGGRSSRMGRDKALLELGGKPLVARAVEKLQRVCADVRVVSGNDALADYAPLVGDVHPGCGPIGGIEAALLQSSYEWNLFLAVDMPFVPAIFIYSWVEQMMGEDDGARICMFTADGRAQPGLCMVHKEVAPFLSDAIGRGEFALMPALEAAGRGSSATAGLWNRPAMEWSVDGVSERQLAARHLWFANLNTPEEFAEAERWVEALDA